MLVHCGYTDGTGDYYISIDTEKCDGCGLCVGACPKGLFQVEEDDYDELKAQVKRELVKSVGYLCPGHEHCTAATPCFEVCPPRAIDISWA
ncbi:MAG: 4Fe-4S binding protein [Chloroflexi bacterium]|nr:4Fe-4S binding protein [Chloroflexota bacterium]